MKSSSFYGNCRNKTPTLLSRILDLADENALPYRSENDQFSVTVLPPTKLMLQVILQAKTHEMRMEQERFTVCQGACF